MCYTIVTVSAGVLHIFNMHKRLVFCLLPNIAVFQDPLGPPTSNRSRSQLIFDTGYLPQDSKGTHRTLPQVHHIQLEQVIYSVYDTLEAAQIL